jgi:rhamnose utilization protein RhaD (predicted bifunctional aldolase and dehydrogenase)
VAASIDTPLHGFLPFPHVDHLHPDWGIALAASANGKAKMEEFNREFQSLAGLGSLAAPGL